MVPNPEPESEKDPFLDHLRQRFADEQELPSPELWAALSPQLPAPNPWLTRYVGGGTGVGLVLGLLLGWLVGLPGAAPVPATEPVSVVAVAPVTRQQPAAVAAPVRVTVPVTMGPAAVAPVVARRTRRSTSPQRAVAAARNSVVANTPAPAPAVASVSAATAVAPSVVVPPKAPVFLLPSLWHSALVLDSAIRQEATAPVAPVGEQRTRLAALLAAQQPVLLALQHHLDSLRATTRTPLTEVPATLAHVDSVPPLAAAADTLQPRPLAPPRRWSALLLSEATTRWGELPGYHAATTRELLVSAQTQAVAVEYHVPDAAGTPGRWRLRAGFGETRLRD